MLQEMRHAHGVSIHRSRILKTPVRAAIIRGEKRVAFVVSALLDHKNSQTVFKFFTENLLANQIVAF
jgi:hypothetical protein